MDLTQEFHADHQKAVSALFGSRHAIARRARADGLKTQPSREANEAIPGCEQRHSVACGKFAN